MPEGRFRGRARGRPSLRGLSAKTDGYAGMAGALLGPSFRQIDIEQRLTKAGARFSVVSEDTMVEFTAEALRRGGVAEKLSAKRSNVKNITVTVDDETYR